jgi:hypothetical protein
MRVVIPQELVGEGSFGKVYRARWRGMVVAVKELKLSHDIAEDMLLKELHHEALMMSRVCNHDNVIKFVGVTKVRLGCNVSCIPSHSLPRYAGWFVCVRATVRCGNCVHGAWERGGPCHSIVVKGLPPPPATLGVRT